MKQSCYRFIIVTGFMFAAGMFGSNPGLQAAAEQPPAKTVKRADAPAQMPQAASPQKPDAVNWQETPAPGVDEGIPEPLENVLIAERAQAAEIHNTVRIAQTPVKPAAVVVTEKPARSYDSN